jgi:Predicted transcriptional regulators containing the CopG/Arc/MetJ DNA-binding domain and a metal-binding domain
LKTVNLKCTQVGLSIPQELVDRIDLVRGDVTRSRYIWRMLETKFASENINENLGNGSRIGTPAPNPKSSRVN